MVSSRRISPVAAWMSQTSKSWMSRMAGVERGCTQPVSVGGSDYGEEN